MDIYYIASEFVLPETPGAPLPLLVQQILRSAIEFCAETNIYTSSITPVSLVPGTRTYTLTPTETNTSMVRPQILWIGNTILSPTRIQDVETAAVVLSGEGRPSFYTFSQPNTVILYPTPDSSVVDTLKGRVVVAPADNSTVLPDWLANRYLDIITAGAKTRLMAMQNKPWTHLDLSARFARIYSAGITNAKIEANKSFTMTDLRIR